MGTAKAKERRRRRKGNGAKGASNVKQSRNSIDESNRVISATLTNRPHSTLLIQLTEETPVWFDCGRNTAGRDDTIFDADNANKLQNVKSTLEVVSKYRLLADETYRQEVALSRKSAGGSAYSEKDEKWVERTMKRGTLKDRVAAMSVVVGMDCMHKLYALDMLLDLAGCGIAGADIGSVPNARVGQMASEALSDLFVNTLLPKDRKLVTLESRPLYLYEGGRTLSPRVLLLWRYEEMIKQRYASYLSRYLGRTLAGEDEPSKKNALETASMLLMQIPEGEELLLTMIVNKIGDPGRKIACAAGHQLRLLLKEHPVMLNVIAREVQQLAHRPHLSPRALYNCIVFLNQLQLSHCDNDDGDCDVVVKLLNGQKAHRPTSLPASLINTYFHLFETAVDKEEEKKKVPTQHISKSLSSGMRSRLLSALLTGVNRAHPYLPKKDAGMEKHIDALYRIAHMASPAAATQALMLLLQLAVGGSLVADEDESVTVRKDRFYRALYSKLLDCEMFSGRQLTLFFNLLYKAMKCDTSTERISAFAKRLLHTALHLSSSLMCASIFLLSEIVRCRPELREGVKSMLSGVSFDPAKREPRAAFSGKISLTKNLWELSLFAHHFHPSVSKFTCDSGGGIRYKGDPLKDFALSPFLDKFAFRNPKSMEKLSKHINRGESIAEKKSGLSGSLALPMNDPSYLDPRIISEEEKFFHQFFVERAKRDKIKGIVRSNGISKDKNDSDLEDEALNAVEVDGTADNFEGDTDSEEEAFVNQLAEKLMESACNGKTNFDDEDPDMDDWSDFDSEDHEREKDKDDYKKDDDSRANLCKGGDEDSFMDEDEDNADLLKGELGTNELEVRGDLPFHSNFGINGRRKGDSEEPTSIYADANEYFTEELNSSGDAPPPQKKCKTLH